MASPSLTYEILMYLNSFYFGMFSACEMGIGILKAVNLEYDSPELLEKEMALLVGMILIESIRIYFGRHGSLSDRGRYRAQLSGNTQFGCYGNRYRTYTTDALLTQVEFFQVGR